MNSKTLIMKQKTEGRSIQDTLALRLGQEFLDSFKKIPYNEDRLGQSFVMKSQKPSVETKK